MVMVSIHPFILSALHTLIPNSFHWFFIRWCNCGPPILFFHQFFGVTRSLKDDVFGSLLYLKKSKKITWLVFMPPQQTVVIFVCLSCCPSVCSSRLHVIMACPAIFSHIFLTTFFYNILQDISTHDKGVQGQRILIFLKYYGNWW